MKAVIILHFLFVIVTIAGGASWLYQSRTGRRVQTLAVAAWALGLHGLLVTAPVISTNMDGVSRFVLIASWGVLFSALAKSLVIAVIEGTRSH